MLAKKTSGPDFQAAILAFLPAFALLLNFLNYQDYPYLRFESLLVMSALLTLPLLALVLSMLWRPAGYLVASVVIFAYVDSIVPIMEKLAVLDSMGLQQRWRFAVYVAAVLLICWSLFRAGAVVRKVLVVVFSVIALSTVVNGVVSAKTIPSVRDDPQANFQGDPSLPPYIHVLWDAHIGVNGVPAEIPGGTATRDQMIRFFDRYGFRVFPGAFSHYYKTRDSMTNLVGFTEEATSFGGTVKRNRLFETLKARGYRIRVYETDHLDYCDSERVHVDFCYNYVATGLAGLKSANLPRTQKALLIAGLWLGTMQSVHFSRNILYGVLEKFVGPKLANVPLFGNNALYDRSGGVNATAAFQRLKQDVREHPTGSAFFVHLMLPHAPFIYNADCSPSADPRGWSSDFDSPRDPLSETERAARYGQYLPQVQCIYHLLDNWFTELRKEGLFDRATIVVHGDHGSRISTDPRVGNQTDPEWRRMVRDSFSTLFAVRAPKIDPGLDTVVKPVNRLARELIEAPDRLSQADPDGLFLMLHTDWHSSSEMLQRYPVPADFFAADKASPAADAASKR